MRFFEKVLSSLWRYLFSKYKHHYITLLFSACTFLLNLQSAAKMTNTGTDYFGCNNLKNTK